MNKPVILLAFANNQLGAKAYLRALPEEMNRLRKILDKASEDGLCEIVLLPNATLDDLIEVFQKKIYRNRIAIFHFGGHADSYELLFEAVGKESQSAHADGLLPLIASQKGLRLVFLNGCFSIRQVSELLELGVPAVIGTVKAVSDKLATKLAATFYHALAEGASIELAWKESTLKMQAEKGKNDFLDYYQPGEAMRGFNLLGETDRFPWDIQFRDGAEDVRDWNLPLAASNPYFGLPSIPAGYGLPEEPFQFLKPYSSWEARVFFGRGKEIRAICQRLSNPLAAPVLLLYGQSGVGKSSLLHAGIVPRLETEYHLIYLRRNSEKGLSAQLREVLGSAPVGLSPAQISNPLERSLKEMIRHLEIQMPLLSGQRQSNMGQIIEALHKHLLDMEEPAPPSLDVGNIRSRWLHLEKWSGKKGVILILDQAEEIFTQPCQKAPAELDNLMQDLVELFGDLGKRLNGKLVISYRKEYHPEISMAIRSAALHHEHLFLERMDQAGIEEVVGGLASTPELQYKYRLDVEPGLPSGIAEFLLSDTDTPVSPVLQIILAQMWKREGDSIQRQFQIKTFNALRQEGVLLKDFFEQQMDKLRQWEKEIGCDVERSGLALDILSQHTTSYGTANTWSFEELRNLYQHREAFLAPLLEQCKSLYLLSDIFPGTTSLGHDTLALLVQHEARMSNRPGQRASRILNAKIIDFQRSPHDTVIEPDDLKLVEAGVGGMRKWHFQEVELVSKSRRHRRKVRMIRNSALGFLLAAVLATGLFWRQRQVLERKQQMSFLYNEALFLDSEGKPKQALAQIVAALDLDPEDPGAIQIRNDIYQNNEFFDLQIQGSNPISEVLFDPIDSLILAVSGAKVQIYDRSGVLQNTYLHEDRVLSAQWLPQGKGFVTGAADHVIRFWGLDGNLIQSWYGHLNGVSAIAFSPFDQSLFSADRNGTWIRWSSEGSPLLKMDAHRSAITGLAVSPNGKFVATSSNDSTVQIRFVDGSMKQTLLLEDRVFSVQFSQDGNHLLTADRTAKACLWNLQGQRVQEFRGHGARVNYARFSKDGQYVFTCSDDRLAACWDIKGNLLKTYRGHANFVNALDISPSSDLIVTGGEDGMILFWRRQSKVDKTLGPLPHEATSLIFSKNGNRLYVGSGDGELRSLSFDNNRSRSSGQQPIYAYDLKKGTSQIFLGHIGSVQSLEPGIADDFYSGGKHGEIIHWGPEGLLDKWDAHFGSVEALSYHSRSGLLSGGADNQVILWDPTKKALNRFSHSSLVSGLAWSPDGTLFASVSLDDTLRMWNLDGSLLASVKGQGGTMEALAWSPNGKYIAIGEGGREPILGLYTAGGALIFKVITKGINKTGGRAVTAVAFSPDSRLIVCSNEGGAIEIFNLNGTLVQRIEESDQFSSRDVRFSPDGKWIAFGSDDGKVRLARPIAHFPPQ